MGRDASYPRVAAPRSGTRLELLGFRLKLLLSAVLVSAFGWLVLRAPLHVNAVRPTPRRTGPISKFNLQTLYFPRFGPHIVNYHATRPRPCLPVGSQVEKGHDKLTSGQQTGRGAELGVTNWGISAAALSLGGATLPSSSLAGPAFAGRPIRRFDCALRQGQRPSGVGRTYTIACQGCHSSQSIPVCQAEGSSLSPGHSLRNVPSTHHVWPACQACYCM